jgi:hypothetical protein
MGFLSWNMGKLLYIFVIFMAVDSLHARAHVMQITILEGLVTHCFIMLSFMRSIEPTGVIILNPSQPSRKLPSLKVSIPFSQHNLPCYIYFTNQTPFRHWLIPFRENARSCPLVYVYFVG